MVKNALKNKGKKLKLTTLGFTLIELLAVIVILAIIALIATPIILGIIRDAKENANKRSAEMYLNAVEQATVRRNLKEKFNPTFCEIQDNGNLLCNGYTDEITIDIGGEKPKEGIIFFSDGLVARGVALKFKDYIANKKDDEIVIDSSPQKEEINHLSQKNVFPVIETIKTTGIVPEVDEEENIKVGSEFKIKVNDTSGWLTFFVLSNSDDGKYVNLIAEQNITLDGKFTSERQDGDGWYGGAMENRYGPRSAYPYLSAATSNWINIPIIESFTYEDEGYSEGIGGYKSIKTEIDNETSNYITIITPHGGDPTIFSDPAKFENMRARLPYINEIIVNTECKIYLSSADVGNVGKCPVWMINYLKNSKYYTKTDSTTDNRGYWTLSSQPDNKYRAFAVMCNGMIAGYETYSIYYGIRPVITVLKSDLLRAM